MAQMKEIEFEALPYAVWVKVGHNRRVQRNVNRLDCQFHGNTVAIFRKDAAGGFDVTLDHCGYMTTSTMAAIRDFLKFIGVSAGVSRAKGKFSARYQIKRGVYLDQAATDDGQRIYFHAPYVSPWSHGVIIGDVFPAILAIKATGQYTAEKAANHIREQMPHLKECVTVADLDNVLPSGVIAASGFLKDCAQAYCMAWRGRGVALREGGEQ